jgi:ABC-type iron transport system FetAB ATPase subunit
MANLVVDACVARSCGDRTATTSPAPECRDFLLAMQEHKHKVVMTKDIKAEWDKHQSEFATRWRSQMVGRKLLRVIPVPEIDQEIWKPIEDMAQTDKKWAAMVKDILLLEAALATDHRIVSLDEKSARKYFTEAAHQIKQLRQLVWVNPSKTEEKAIAWLQDGAPAEEKRMLGFLDSGLE